MYEGVSAIINREVSLIATELKLCQVGKFSSGDVALEVDEPSGFISCPLNLKNNILWIINGL